jgi:hypothetical protein
MEIRRGWRWQRDVGDRDKKACTVELFPLEFKLLSSLD